MAASLDVLVSAASASKLEPAQVVEHYSQCAPMTAHVTSKPKSARSRPKTRVDRSSPPYAQKRHPRARRRKPHEVPMEERWYCPKKCGRHYRYTSTKSIRTHICAPPAPPCFIPYSCPLMPLGVMPPADPDEAPSLLLWQVLAQTLHQRTVIWNSNLLLNLVCASNSSNFNKNN
jgi:hypothetical protein